MAGLNHKATRLEQKERAFIASLATDPSRADIALMLTRLVCEQGRALNSVLGLERWCLTTDPHTRSLEPFVFVHIPKTAGTIIRLIIRSLFDDSRIFPGLNYDDYRTFGAMDLASRIDPTQHGVFIGHMAWDSVLCIETSLQRKATIFTVLREPVSHYRSHLAFVDVMENAGITSMTFNGEDIDFAQVWNDQSRATFGTTLLDFQVGSILGAESPYKSNLEFVVLSDDERRRLRELLVERLGTVHVAFFEDLRRSIDLFCKNLELPYQFIPELRLNSSFADHSSGLGAEQLSQVEQRRSLSFEFDKIARERFRTEYEAAFAGINDVPTHLNSRYRAALMSKLEPCWCVYLDGGCAWPGYGWGFRENYEYSQAFRQLGPDGRGTILAKLHGGCSYFVSLTVAMCDDEQTLTRIVASANGNTVHFEGRDFIGGQFVLNWLMPSSYLAKADGAVELVFELSRDNGARSPFFAVSAITIYPATIAPGQGQPR